MRRAADAGVLIKRLVLAGFLRKDVQSRGIYLPAVQRFQQRIGVRGRPKVARPGWGALLDPLDGDDMAELEVTLQARRREHSRKPDAAFDAIEGMFPDSAGRRIELFSREARDGWRAWGNELGKFPPPVEPFLPEAGP